MKYNIPGMEQGFRVLTCEYDNEPERRTITIKEEGEGRQRLSLSLNEHCSDSEHEKESLKDHTISLLSFHGRC